MGPPFERHPTPAADIRDRADRMSRSRGRLADLMTALDGPGRQAADSVDGVVDGTIDAPVSAAQKAAMEAAAGADLCRGAVELYADHVQIFDHGVDDLNRRWANAVRHDFFVAGDEDDRDAAVEDARGAEAAALREEYARLEEGLDLGAAYVAAALRAGPDTGVPQLARHKSDSEAALSHLARPEYEALGDSYSAGTGVGEYYTHGPGDPYRSYGAYGWLLARKYGLRINHRATSSATTYDIDKHQLTGLGPDTRYVTLTAGGNNVGFGPAVGAAAAIPGPVGGWISKRAIDASRRKIRTTAPAELDALYDEIRMRAPNATIVVGTYPQLFDGEDGPSDQFKGFIDVEEERAMNAAADELDSVITRQAAEHGFEVAEARDEFAGHDLEAPDGEAWLNGLRFRLSNHVTDSFHPNAEGQQGYAEAFDEYFRR